jgi:hypothetical protein
MYKKFTRNTKRGMNGYTIVLGSELASEFFCGYFFPE